MGANVPSGPSESEIKAEEQEQQRRIRFEEEKRQFLGEVGAYELMTQSAIDRRASSLEYQTGPMSPPPESLFVPAKFTPTIDFDPKLMKDYEWMEAKNLGFAGYSDAVSAEQRAANEAYYNAMKSYNSWANSPEYRMPGNQMLNAWRYNMSPEYTSQNVSQEDIQLGRYARPTGPQDALIQRFLANQRRTNT